MAVQQVRFWHKCIECGAVFDPDRPLYVCSSCGGLLMVERDEDWITRQIGEGRSAQRHFDTLRATNWNRYPFGSGVFLWLDHILPGFPEEAVISLREGFTDLWEFPQWLLKKIGLKSAYAKAEGQLPSDSFKDRGMAVAASDTLRLQMFYPELSIKGILCASTGDTSTSAGKYASWRRDRLSCTVLLPAGRVSPEQLALMRSFGVDVLLVDHPRGFDRCMELAEEYSELHSDMVLVNSKNDMRLVGQETGPLEICQESGWKAPDWVVLPVGNAGHLTSYLESFLRMKRRGLIDRLPKFVAVQAKGANTLVRWARSGFKDYEPGDGSQPTLATAMYIQDPVSFRRVKKLAPEFEIHWFDVSEEELKESWALLLSAGADACPQSAVTFHGGMQAREAGIIKEGDSVIFVFTASFLKFANAAVQHLQGLGGFAKEPPVVQGTREAVEQALAV